MDESRWKRVQGVMMTNESISAYGGIQFPTTLLEQIATQINDGAMPFHIGHDLTRPARIRNVTARVESRDDGVDVLRFDAVIHVDDVDLIGTFTGVSATVTAPIERDEDHPAGPSPLDLSADHAWFGDDDLIAAERDISARGVDQAIIRVQRAYQFSLTPDPQIFLTIAYDLLVGVAGGAIWDGLKTLLRRRQTPPGADPTSPTTMNIDVTDGDQTFRASVSTTDASVAQHAIEALPDAATAFLHGRPPAKRADAASAQPELAQWDATNGWTPRN